MTFGFPPGEIFDKPETFQGSDSPKIRVTFNITDPDGNFGSSTDTVGQENLVQTRHRLFPLAGFTYALSDSVGNVGFIDQSQIDPVIAAGYNPQFGYQWEWDFDDGSQNSTLQNPVHTYNPPEFRGPKTYNVTQCVWFVENQNDPVHPVPIRGNCDTQPVHVFVEGPKTGISAIIAMDGTNPTLYINSLSQPGSSPLITWEWDLTKDGDPVDRSRFTCSGNPLASGEPLFDPVLCKYTLGENYGVYNVTLTVTDAAGNLAHAKETVEYSRTTPVKPAVAMFTAAPLIGSAPHTVSFTDLSVGDITEWKWYIENENDDSVEVITEATEIWPHLVHTFTKAGVYNVTLEITTANGIANRSIPSFIHVGKPEFLAIPREGPAPLTVTFTDLSSVGPVTRTWFTDGTIIDGTEVTGANCKTGCETKEKVVSIKYDNPGLYPVTLQVCNESKHCATSDEEVITVLLPVPPLIKANFDAAPLRGPAHLTVYFTDRSTNAEEWHWSFGTDDCPPRTGQNPPPCTYKAPGAYTVTLQVKDKDGNFDWDIREDYINVDLPLIKANFFAFPREGPAPLTVYFTDLSTNAEEWEWDFGDGDGATSTERDPSYTYTESGTYTVTLQIKDKYGHSDKADGTITVTGSVVDELEARFEIDHRRVYPGDPVTFTDISIGNPIYWEWTFDARSSDTPPDVRGGYGIFDPDKLPEHKLTHVYTNPGWYNVTLTVRDAAGNVDTLPWINAVQVLNPQIEADFEFWPCDIPNDCSWPRPHCVRFHDTSRGDVITSWEWDFSNGDVGSGPDVQSCFAVGDHVVILRVANNLVTDSEYKVVTVPVS